MSFFSAVKATFVASALASISLTGLAGHTEAKDLKEVRVGWCAKVINSGALPWAVAQKLGYMEEEGLKVRLVPVASGNDCVTFVANGELTYALPAIEPLAGIIAKGFKATSFFTLYNGTTWRIAVPHDSDIQSVKDLKGKRIGVASMSSVMVAVTKGLMMNAGLDPERDATFVSVGAAASAVLAAKRGEVDCFAMWDIADSQIEHIGLPLREIEVPELNSPSLSIISSSAYFAENKDEATRLARAYAKAATFTFANPRAALEMLYEVYPENRTPGVDAGELIRSDLDFVEMRRNIWVPNELQNNQWGNAPLGSYTDYLGNLARWGMLTRKVEPAEFITNELIDAVNDFDRAGIEKAAAYYKG